MRTVRRWSNVLKLGVVFPMMASCSGQEPSASNGSLDASVGSSAKRSSYALQSASSAGAAATETITVSLKAPAYRVRDLGDGWSTIEADNFALRGSLGQPLLPHGTLTVVLPPNVDPSSVSLTLRDVITQVEPVTVKVPGTPRMQSMNDPTRRPYSAPITPAEVLPAARLAPVESLRKWRLAVLDFVPFRYDPSSGSVTSVSSATAEIRFSRGGKSPSAALMAEKQLDGLMAKRAINFASAAAWYSQAAVEAGTVSPVRRLQSTTLHTLSTQSAAACPSSDAPWTYVIVTTNAIKNGSAKLADFIDHKELHRKQYVKVVTEDDYDSLTGAAPNSRADKIRQWLINNYEAHSIQYVLLIGNPTPRESIATPSALASAMPNWVPMKMCYPGWTTKDELEAGLDAFTSHLVPDTEKQPETPTDYYYSNLDSDWNKGGTSDHACEFVGDYEDNDGYARPTAGENRGMSLTPNVFVGRIPVYNSDGYADLDRILQKSIDYQMAMDDTSWRLSALMTMGFLSADTDTADVSEAIWNDYLQDAPGFTKYTIYDEGMYPCTKPPYPGFTDDCRIAINNDKYHRYAYAPPNEALLDEAAINRWAIQPYGLVFWSGHGGYDGIGIGWGSDPSTLPDGGKADDGVDCWAKPHDDAGNELSVHTVQTSDATRINDA